jgi:puromycin-sensitive aminopeptidase
VLSRMPRVVQPGHSLGKIWARGVPGSLPPMSSTTENGTTPDEAYRLPRNARPERYDLILEPDLEAATFVGSEVVALNLVSVSDTIVLNSAELKLSNVEVELPDGSVHAGAVSYDLEAERATLTFESQLPAGPLLLRCGFTGILNDKLRGFYRSTFTDPAGVVQTIATTQMESTDARRAFPCWDEPAAKAVFGVTLIVSPGLAAYSNSPIEEVTESGGKQHIRFSPTMKMSTYLVAFVVGALEATEAVDVDGVPLRIVHAPGKANLTEFALEIAEFSLKFFSSYFDIPYPGDKVDLVAIPDFAFGAMENLGCVTFRETALLVDRETAARAELERVADVVAHELAHMWFGDLVTMDWWEGIWLNEAFATFMETACVDAFRPAWQRWVSFGTSREGALAIDGLHATRPIEYPVGSPEEADGMFDVLTYEKGCSVLRMLEQFLSPDVFRDGVRHYLRAHSYANTVTADLWSSLESVSGQPVGRVMDTWILQGGHPLVTVSGGTVSQEPFAFGPVPAGFTSAIGSHWQIPIATRQLGSDDVTTTLLADEPLQLDANDGHLVVNAGGWGVFRTAYEPSHLATLADHLFELAPLERANLFVDTWASTLAGHTELASFLELGQSLGQEEEPSTWGAIVGGLALCDRVADDHDRPALADAARHLLGPRGRALGFDPQPGESERTPTLRALLISALGEYGQDPDIRAEAAHRFDHSPMGGGTGPTIASDVEGAVLGIVAELNRPGDYEKVLARYRSPSDPQQEMRSLNALAAFQDTELCLATFDLAVNEVRTQNAPYLVASLLRNAVGGPAVWHRLTEQWSELLAKFPHNSHSRMIEGVRVLCADPTLAASVVEFLLEHPIQAGSRSVTQTIERLGINVAFGQRVRPTLGAVFAAITVPSA